MSKSTITKNEVIIMASQLFTREFTRKSWDSHPKRPVAGSTITNWFGSWSSFQSQIPFKTTQLVEVIDWATDNYVLPPTRTVWDSCPNRPVHSDTIQQWMGWNKFAVAAWGHPNRISPDATDNEIREWIRNSTSRNDKGCWISPTSLSPSGYGRISINGLSRRLHQVSYELYVGNIPTGHVIRHTCDTPACCNPSHLTTGTRSENAVDYTTRDHKPRGASVRESRPTGLAHKQIYQWLVDNSVISNECHMYPTPHPTSGYGVMQIMGDNWQAHRFIRCHLDGLPKDHQQIVRHTCHNRACINPDHLVWGTPSDNRRDDINAGKNIKITPEIRNEIQEAWSAWSLTKSEFDRKYAGKYKVSTGTIRNHRMS